MMKCDKFVLRDDLMTRPSWQLSDSSHTFCAVICQLLSLVGTLRHLSDGMSACHSNLVV